MKYIAKQDFTIGGKFYKKGEEVDFDKEQAERLASLVEIKGKAPAKPSKNKQVTRSKKK